jgi:hypothetical protein
MRRFLFLFPLAAVCAAFAADSQFNGRWDIRVVNESRRRAWWLEVSGAGTAGLKGRFVGFPGGDMNDIEKIAITDGVLRFSFDRPARGENGAIHQEYTARLAGDKLEGTMKAGR